MDFIFLGYKMRNSELVITNISSQFKAKNFIISFGTIVNSAFKYNRYNSNFFLAFVFSKGTTISYSSIICHPLINEISQFSICDINMAFNQLPFLECILMNFINQIANSQEGRVRFGLFSNSVNIKRVTCPEKCIDLKMFGLFFLRIFSNLLYKHLELNCMSATYKNQ